MKAEVMARLRWIVISWQPFESLSRKAPRSPSINAFVDTFVFHVDVHFPVITGIYHKRLLGSVIVKTQPGITVNRMALNNIATFRRLSRLAYSGTFDSWRGGFLLFCGGFLLFNYI